MWTIPARQGVPNSVFGSSGQAMLAGSSQGRSQPLARMAQLYQSARFEYILAASAAKKSENRVVMKSAASAAFLLGGVLAADSIRP